MQPGILPFWEIMHSMSSFPIEHSQVVNSGAKQLQDICCTSSGTSLGPLGLSFPICKAEGVSVCMCECVHTHVCPQIWRSHLEGPLEDYVRSFMQNSGTSEHRPRANRHCHYCVTCLGSLSLRKHQLECPCMDFAPGSLSGLGDA